MEEEELKDVDEEIEVEEEEGVDELLTKEEDHVSGEFHGP